jgi:hypothetical protein
MHFHIGTNERMGIIRVNTSGYVEGNTNDPKCHLQVNGIGKINNSSFTVVFSRYMQSGSLTIPGTDVSYGGGDLWNANTAGLMMES